MGEQETETNVTETSVVEQQVVIGKQVVVEKPNQSIWLGSLGLLVLVGLAPVYGSQYTTEKVTEKAIAKTASLSTNASNQTEPIPSSSPIAPVTLATPTIANSPAPVSTPAPTSAPVPTPAPAVATKVAVETGPRLSLAEAESAMRRAVPNLSLAFPPHSAELGITQKRALERVAGILKRSPVTTIELGGYAEEEVQNSRMVSLGISRVRMSALYMVSKGAPLEQISGVSYGARTFSPNAPASGIEIRINKKN
jgi:outer membrane protein OmpA-like peptidoglycan-associated protein